MYINSSGKRPEKLGSCPRKRARARARARARSLVQGRDRMGNEAAQGRQDACATLGPGAANMPDSHTTRSFYRNGTPVQSRTDAFETVATCSNKGERDQLSAKRAIAAPAGPGRRPRGGPRVSADQSMPIQFSIRSPKPVVTVEVCGRRPSPFRKRWSCHGAQCGSARGSSAMCALFEPNGAPGKASTRGRCARGSLETCRCKGYARSSKQPERRSSAWHPEQALPDDAIAGRLLEHLQSRLSSRRRRSSSRQREWPCGSFQSSEPPAPSSCRGNRRRRPSQQAGYDTPVVMNRTRIAELRRWHSRSEASCRPPSMEPDETLFAIGPDLWHFMLSGTQIKNTATLAEYAKPLRSPTHPLPYVMDGRSSGTASPLPSVAMTPSTSATRVD